MWRYGGLALALLVLGGCNPKVKVEPLEVKPIEVTVNINVKIDRELDQFFDFDKPAPSRAPAAGTASQPTEGGM